MSILVRLTFWEKFSIHSLGGNFPPTYNVKILDEKIFINFFLKYFQNFHPIFYFLKKNHKTFFLLFILYSKIRILLYNLNNIFTINIFEDFGRENFFDHLLSENISCPLFSKIFLNLFPHTFFF